MINEKTKEDLAKKFGSLMMRRVIVINMIKSYDKEIKDIDKEMEELIEKYTGDKKDGSTVQQA